MIQYTHRVLEELGCWSRGDNKMNMRKQEADNWATCVFNWRGTHTYKKVPRTLLAFFCNLNFFSPQRAEYYRPLHNQPWLISRLVCALFCSQINTSATQTRLPRQHDVSRLRMQDTHQSNLCADEHVRHPARWLRSGIPPGATERGVLTDKRRPLQLELQLTALSGMRKHPPRRANHSSPLSICQQPALHRVLFNWDRWFVDMRQCARTRRKC